MTWGKRLAIALAGFLGATVGAAVSNRLLSPLDVFASEVAELVPSSLFATSVWALVSRPGSSRVVLAGLGVAGCVFAVVTWAVPIALLLAPFAVLTTGWATGSMLKRWIPISSLPYVGLVFALAVLAAVWMWVPQGYQRFDALFLLMFLGPAWLQALALERFQNARRQVESRPGRDEMAREEGPAEKTDGAAAVRRVALGATNASTILLGLGAVWWLYSLLYARTTAPGSSSEDVRYWGDWLPYPWEMPLVLWSIPLALAALALFVSGVRLQRPRESARRVVDLSALILMVPAAIPIGLPLGQMLVMVAKDTQDVIGYHLGVATFGSWPFWLIIVYGWCLRAALWRTDIVQACGGQVDRNGTRIGQRMLSGNLLSIAAGMVVGMVAGGVYWPGW